MKTLGQIVWVGDVPELRPAPPCFDHARYGCKCRRPRGHDGPHLPRPLEGEETSPSSREINCAYGRRRAAKLKRAGVSRLGEIRSEPAYWSSREVARRRGEQRK